MAVKYHKCRDAEEVCEFINRRSKITVISISQQYTWLYSTMTTNQLKEALETRNWRYKLLWLRCKLLDIHPSSVRMSGMVMSAGYIDICPVCGKVHNIPMWQMMWNEYPHSRRLKRDRWRV